MGCNKYSQCLEPLIALNEYARKDLQWYKVSSKKLETEQVIYNISRRKEELEKKSMKLKTIEKTTTKNNHWNQTPTLWKDQ